MATQRDLSSAAGGVTERLKQDGKQKIESSKRSAADQIDEVARALNRAGEQLNESQPTIANYAGQMASNVSRLATRLRDGSIDDLVKDTRELAKRNPGMFLAGGVALGFALSRFLKASGEQTSSTDYSDDYTSGDDYSAGNYPEDTAGYTGTTQRGEQDTTIGVESTTYASGERSRDDYSASRTNGG
jgi:hypothetical protein